MTLAEAYRPRTWGDFVGHDRAKNRIAALRPRGLASRAYWISGPSGAGKTSMALLLAAELADPLNIVELDAAEATPARLRDLEASSTLYGMGAKPGRAYILNEAHGLRVDAVRQLLVILERLPRHVAWIFTTTRDGENDLFQDAEDAGPLLSRCVVLKLDRKNLAEAFAERARYIAEAEGLGGATVPAFLSLVREKRNNLRAVLAEVECGRMAVQA